MGFMVSQGILEIFAVKHGIPQKTEKKWREQCSNININQKKFPNCKNKNPSHFEKIKYLCIQKLLTFNKYY